MLDAVAVGQITPGPVCSSATFIGYLLGGIPGAAVATAGIFTPAFLFVSMLGPLASRLRRSPTVAAVLKGLNAASFALMTAVMLRLGRSAILDPTTLVLTAAAVVLLSRYRINSTWLFIGGGLIGFRLKTAGLP